MEGDELARVHGGHSMRAREKRAGDSADLGDDTLRVFQHRF